MWIQHPVAMSTQTTDNDQLQTTEKHLLALAADEDWLTKGEHTLTTGERFVVDEHTDESLPELEGYIMTAFRNADPIDTYNVTVTKAHTYTVWGYVYTFTTANVTYNVVVERARNRLQRIKVTRE